MITLRPARRTQYNYFRVTARVMVSQASIVTRRDNLTADAEDSTHRRLTRRRGLLRLLESRLHACHVRIGHLFPLNRGGRLAGDVIGHARNAVDLVDDAQ